MIAVGHPLDHNQQRVMVADGLANVICRVCGETLYAGPASGLIEWLSGGPAPWSPAANQ